MTAHSTATIPAPDDLLCEGCGYVLNGLPSDGRCPECAKPIPESTAPTLRTPPAWEQAARPRIGAFVTTTAAVLFAPTRFFRGLATRPHGPAASRFARIHWLIASVLIGAGGWLHLDWYDVQLRSQRHPNLGWLPLFALLTYAAFDLTTRLATRLTAWEAAYRGLRLPHATVLRGMHYHAAQYLAPAALFLATVLANHFIGGAHSTAYVYTLCAEVVASAVYLFKTYWIAMRNMMYANA